jgi:hypothetical protein
MEKVTEEEEFFPMILADFFKKRNKQTNKNISFFLFFKHKIIKNTKTKLKLFPRKTLSFS